MKIVNRALLRGAPLETMCRQAKTTHHEFGREDRRVFCFGVTEAGGANLMPPCRTCRAHVDYARPAGCMVASEGRRSSRLYYVGHRDGRPCFSAKRADAVVMELHSAAALAEECMRFTGKVFSAQTIRGGAEDEAHD